MKWEVRITGDKQDLEELSKCLVSQELAISERDGEYFIESSRLNPTASDTEIREVANHFLTLLNGAAKLALQARTPIQIVDLARVHSNGHSEVFVLFESKVVLRSALTITSTLKDGTTETIRPVDPVPGWLRAAEQNENVAKALRLAGSGINDWSNLYRLLEVIENDVGSETVIIENGWASRNGIKCFKHTANSPSVTGDNSRHGKERTSPPANPLELTEARALIETILYSWLKFNQLSS